MKTPRTLRDILSLALPAVVPGLGYVLRAETAPKGWVSIYGIGGALHSHGRSRIDEHRSTSIFPLPEVARA